MRPICYVSLLILTCLFLAMTPSKSQTISYPSDVIILVVPNGSQTILSVTFAKEYPRRDVKKRLDYLVSFAGWHALSFDIQNDKLKGMTQGATAIQTSATILLDHPLIKQNDAYWLQPFLNTFSDFNTFEVIYMERMDSNFDGLFDFNAPGVSVKLIQYGSPYRYLFRITNHSAPIPTLPLIQHFISNNPETSHFWGPFAPFALWMIAGGCIGLIMLALYLYRFTHRVKHDE